MATATGPSPIAIKQEAGPNFEVNSGIANYYTEVLTELTGRDAPEAPYIALGAASGGNHSQPDFNKPVSFGVKIARKAGEAADIIASGEEVPMVGLSSSDSGLKAGLTTSHSRLIVTQSPHYDFSYSAEVDSDVPVLRRGVLDGEEMEDYSDDPEKRFVVSPPGRVITDARDPRQTTLRAEVDEVMDEVTHRGFLAVGDKATGRLLEVLAQRELQEGGEGFVGFRESLALLTLAYFREHGHQLPPSKSPFIREAGHQAVSTLIAGGADAVSSTWSHEREEQMRHMVERLGGVEFKAEDHDPITASVLAKMEDGGTREAFTGLANTNGGTVEEFAKGQTANFMTSLLGVKLG